MRKAITHARLPLRSLTAALLLGSALLVAFLSCSSRQQVDLSVNGSGEAQVEIHLTPVLVSYLQDLAATVNGTAPSKSQPIFDLNALKAAFSRYPGLVLDQASTPGIGTLALWVRFADVSRLLDGANGRVADFVDFRRDGDLRTLTVRLDRDVVDQLLTLTPLSGSVAGSVLLPPAGSSMSSEEYVSYLGWALEDYANGADGPSIERIIRSSEVDVDITVEGRIVSAKGGKVKGNVVSFSIPVVKLLTLSNALVYSVSFR
ncbi:hypothetical protein [Salinispira pacifica]